MVTLNPKERRFPRSWTGDLMPGNHVWKVGKDSGCFSNHIQLTVVQPLRIKATGGGPGSL